MGGLRRVAERPRLKKAARIVVVVAASLFFAYLVVGNALLSLGGVERLVNESTSDAHLTLGSGHTWFPGRVEIRDLRLRFEDQNVQFEVSIAKASGRMSLLSLVKKRLYFRALKAEGVRFLLRHKVTTVSGNERRLVHFPRIAGFSDPPLLVPEPPSDKSKNWAFLLENVEARGVELWFMEYRYAGQVDVRGAFELVPGRKLWVGPAQADFHPGELGVGNKRPVARDVRGRLDFRFRETNPDPIPGLEIFRQISAKLALDGKLVDLEAVNLYLSDASKTAVRRGAGQLQARIELVDGRFVPDSYVSVRPSEPVHVVLPNAALRGFSTTELRAIGRAPTRLSVDGSLSDATLNVGTAQPSIPGDVVARVLAARLVTNAADVATPWTIDEAAFRIEGGKVPDLRALSPPKPIGGGTAWFFAHAELAHGAWSGALRADAKRVPVRVGGRRSLLDASLSAAAESKQRDLADGSFRDVELEVTSVRGELNQDELRVNVRAPRVDWSDFPPGVFRGRATLEAPRIEPLLEAVGAPSILIGVWPDAPVDATARFEVGDGLDLRLDLAKSGPFRAMGRLRVCSPAKGAFLVKSGAFSAGLSVRDGALRVVPLAGEKWLEKNAPECPSDG